MYKNYLKTAWRKLTKDRLYSFINIGGLSIGIAVCMLIVLYLAHESSYDKFHINADRIFSVYAKAKFASDTSDIPFMDYNTAPTILKNIPQVQSFVRTYQSFEKTTIEDPLINSSKFSEKKFLFADSNFFNFFSFHLKKGNIESVLNRPFTMVITEQAAKKYFGDANPIGRALKYDNSYTFEITGIVEKAPSNSSIDYDFIGSLGSLTTMKEGGNINRFPDNVISGEFGTYLLLKKKEINKQLRI